MYISFQHTNPRASHESTLLRVGDETGISSYLVDAGEHVTSPTVLDSDGSLDGVFLTHAHTDHYRSLGQVLSAAPDTDLYTSPATAAILEDVYTEANRYQDLGTFESIRAALTPIETWTRLDERVAVLPVPAGHTPGAVGFLFRIDDLQAHGETPMVLVTGDFTTRSVAGFPGLALPESVHADVIIANAATNDEFTTEFTASVSTILERALGGSTALVAASALTGVHAAYVLGHVVADAGRELPIHLVGQAAKHYATLEYDVPFVTPHPQFAHTDEVLEPGAVTVAGPEAPTQGSTNRLFGLVEDDPDAVFVQLTTSESDIVESARCTTHHVRLSNHPSKEQFVEFVDENLPRHLIFKHAKLETAKSIGSAFENLFHWTNDDTREHRLYDDGQWVAPHWVSESGATRIRHRNYRESGPRMPLDGAMERFPTIPLERQSPTLDTEGVNAGRLYEQFHYTPTLQTDESTETERNSDEKQERQEPETEPKTEARPEQEPKAEETGSVADDSAGQSVNQHEFTESESPETDPTTSVQTVAEFRDEVRDRLDSLESTLNEVTTATTPEETVAEGFETVETRFETLETRLDTLDTRLERVSENLKESEPPAVTGTILRQDELVMVRLDRDELDSLTEPLEHDQEVDVSIQF